MRGYLDFADDVGRPMLIVDGTILWARDPELDKF